MRSRILALCWAVLQSRIAAGAAVVLLAAAIVYLTSEVQGPAVHAAVVQGKSHPDALDFPVKGSGAHPDAYDWFNTDKPISLADLKGRVIVLDFWTLCCINCIHTLPELAKLEKKYPNELVVIGVHSPKFENEKNTESIRKAILRYQGTHPVVNDANRKTSGSYPADSMPTLE